MFLLFFYRVHVMSARVQPTKHQVQPIQHHASLHYLAALGTDRLALAEQTPPFVDPGCVCMCLRVYVFC